MWLCVQIHEVSHLVPVVCMFVGVCIFHMGERASQNRVWPALLTSDIKGEEAGVWAVRQGAGRRGEAGKTSKTPWKERFVPSTSWGGQAPWKVSTWWCGLESGMGNYLVNNKSESLISCTLSLPSLCFLATFVLFFNSVIMLMESIKINHPYNSSTLFVF